MRVASVALLFIAALCVAPEALGKTNDPFGQHAGPGGVFVSRQGKAAWGSATVDQLASATTSLRPGFCLTPPASPFHFFATHSPQERPKAECHGKRSLTGCCTGWGLRFCHLPGSCE
jgi:hypothetical protein